MPKPLINENDPKLARLNEILIDYLTKELPKVPSRQLIIADAIGVLVIPVHLAIAIILDIRSLVVATIAISIAYVSIDFPTSSGLVLIFFAVFIILGKSFQSKISEAMLCLLNLASFGFFIKYISKGYQSRSLFSHTLLRPTGPLFDRMGVYAETLPLRTRSTYHEFIEIYQRSRYGDETEFDCLMDEYWRKEQSA